MSYSKYHCSKSPFKKEEEKPYKPRATKYGTDRKTQAALRAEEAGLSDEEAKAYIDSY